MKSTNLLLAATILLIALISQANAEEKFDPLALFEEDTTPKTDVIYKFHDVQECVNAAQRGVIIESHTSIVADKNSGLSSKSFGKYYFEETGQAPNISFYAAWNSKLYLLSYSVDYNAIHCISITNKQ